MIVHFDSPGPLAVDIKARVDAYLDAQDARIVQRRMIAKTVLIFGWALASYVALVFFTSSFAVGALASTSLGLAMAGIGFAIQHDANHGSYPAGTRWRRALGFSLDVMGGSSYLWKVQHNVNHHTFTNVVDADGDIDIGWFARLSPAQTRHGFHRAQHLYIWPLYSLLGVSWVIWSDWRDYAMGAIGTNRFPRPRGVELALFWLGKAIFVVVALAVPLLLHPPAPVLVALLWTYLVLGFTLAVVFQLAHIVEEAQFPVPAGEPPRANTDFVTHQLATTVDFAPRNEVLSWYLGGLNFQIEHHLFPRVCHLHYPAIARLVQEACADHGTPYRTVHTARAALASHVRWLRRMGRAPAVVS